MAAGCRRISITAAAVVDFRSIHRLFVAPCFAFGTGGRICRFLLCPAARTGGKDTKMRFRKTPQEKRTTYKQLDENNHVIAEVTPDGDWGEYDITFHDDKEKEEAHKAVIKKFHAVDDHEVYENLKKWKLPLDEQEAYDRRREKFVRKYVSENGHEPSEVEIEDAVGPNHVVDEPLVSSEESNKSKSRRLTEGSSRTEKLTYGLGRKKSPKIETAKELMATGKEFTHREKQAFRLVFDEEMPANEAAKVMGITKGRVSQLLANLHEKLMQHKEYANFFR